MNPQTEKINREIVGRLWQVQLPVCQYGAMRIADLEAKVYQQRVALKLARNYLKHGTYPALGWQRKHNVALTACNRVLRK